MFITLATPLWTILMRNSTWLSKRCQVKWIEKRAIYVFSPQPALGAGKHPARRVWEHTPLKYYFRRALFHCDNIDYLCTYKLNRMVRWIRWHYMQAQGSEFESCRSEANTPGLGHPPPPSPHTHTQHCIFMSRTDNIYFFLCILSSVTPQ